VLAFLLESNRCRISGRHAGLRECRAAEPEHLWTREHNRRAPTNVMKPSTATAPPAPEEQERERDAYTGEDGNN
jgi:hypothetical protein